ncbi:MAG: hypothetical protein DMG61_04330 [Acidobacteria bacterium]|nr:MAG: hypothetical protein DMG61_04330 [Acidobacteriota bacterium]
MNSASTSGILYTEFPTPKGFAKIANQIKCRIHLPCKPSNQCERGGQQKTIWPVYENPYQIFLFLQQVESIAKLSPNIT